MNQDLLQLIKDYATAPHSKINATLVNKSKDNLAAMLLDLLTLYYNDLNSSALREMVVSVLAGFTPLTEKLGYNGFRQEALTGEQSIAKSNPRMCELPLLPQTSPNWMALAISPTTHGKSSIGT